MSILSKHIPCEKIRGEVWKNLDGYAKEYQVSSFGRVRYKNKDRWYLMAVSVRKNGQCTVNLRVSANKRIRKNLRTLVGNTFIGKCPTGMRMENINGVRTDNAAANIHYVPMSATCARGGRNSRKRSVAKIDRDGNEIEFYGTSKEAGEANHLHPHSVRDRCNGKLKNPFDLLGYSFKWEK